MLECLKPIYNNESKILILGSLPSMESLKKNEYYGNKLNHFWKILSYVFNDNDLYTYEDKKKFLYKHHIALWDVIKCADRKGSLDSNILNEKYNDINSFIKNNNIHKVYVNGTKAEKCLKKYMKLNNINISYVLLPSSSSANTRYTLDEKKDIWKGIII